MASSVASKAPGVYLEIEVKAPAPSLDTGVPVFLGRLAPVATGVSLFASALAGPGSGAPPGAAVVPLDAMAWSRLDAALGTSWATGYLGFAVRGFFQNGGSRCYVATIPDTGLDDALA